MISWVGDNHDAGSGGGRGDDGSSLMVTDFVVMGWEQSAVAAGRGRATRGAGVGCAKRCALSTRSAGECECMEAVEAGVAGSSQAGPRSMVADAGADED